jgi:branched-chain amino acid transport system substrate-binding protein
VSKSTITLGLIVPLSGGAAPEYKGIAPAAKARIALQNAQGGVDGRQISLDIVDDATSPAQDATAAQDLLSKGVFGVIGQSPVLFGGYKVLQKAGVPVTGGGYDGQEWGQQPNTNMFSVTDPIDPHFPAYDGVPNFMKQHGVTTVGTVGYSISPSSTASAKGFVVASQAVGLKKGYLDTSLPFGSVAVGPIALTLKSKGVDGMWLPLDDNTNFAIITAAKQAGVKFKVALSATGYGQALLDEPSAVADADGTYFFATGKPVELATPGLKAYQAALAKYANFTGVPGFDWFMGWTGADMMIKGLQMAGPNPTRKGFIDALHTVNNYDAGGITAPADLTLKSFGHPVAKQCAWIVQLQGTKFVPTPSDGSPTCGTMIPNSDQLP